MKLGNSNAPIIDFDPFNVSTIQTMELGARVDVNDGRAFRFSKNGTTGALGAGLVAQAPFEKANHQGLAVGATAPVGANTVTLTLGATASVLEEYAEGFVSVTGAPGAGQTLKISDQQVAASGANQLVTLFDVIQTALTTSSTASLVHSPYNGTQNVINQTLRLVGVPLVNVPASLSLVNQGFVSGQSFYWSQCYGTASVLADGAIPVGSWLTTSAATAGAVTATSGTLATAELTVPLGCASMQAGVAGKYNPVFLTIL